MKDAATLLLIAALVGLAAVALAEHRADPAPVVNASYQPAWRLMTVCPVQRRNVPILTERNA